MWNQSPPDSATKSMFWPSCHSPLKRTSQIAYLRPGSLLECNNDVCRLHGVEFSPSKCKVPKKEHISCVQYYMFMGCLVHSNLPYFLILLALRHPSPFHNAEFLRKTEFLGQREHGHPQWTRLTCSYSCSFSLVNSHLAEVKGCCI